VMATHDVKSACIGDRIVFMRDGQIRGEYRLKDSAVAVEDREAAILSWLSAQGW